MHFRVWPASIFITVILGCMPGFPTCAGAAGQSLLLFDMDSIRHKPGEITKEQQKIPVGSIKLVDGQFDKAVRFEFPGNVGPGFMTAPVQASPEWDAAAGFSFYVKGDGSTNWGGIELIDRDDYALRYGFCFPIDSLEWRKVAIRWDDLTPELAGPLVGAKGGYAPSRFGNFWFGKWFYWRDYPAHSYAIDQVVLEASLPAAEPVSTPKAPLARIRAKLGAGKPVTLVTMGDSLTDKRHWANRDLLWSELLAKALKQKYGSQVTLVNPAIGGTTLSQNTVLIPRWVHEVPRPDLVTIWFGGNDWETGVRAARFNEYLRLAIKRIRQQTGGSADILVLTTCPSFARWDTMKELESAAMEVAREAAAGGIDVAAEFRLAGNPEEAMKRNYWAWDKVHLGAAGHALTAEAVMKAIQGN